jgi:xeroderma pigmentosum group C-complementing protein
MLMGYVYHNKIPGWFRVILSLEEESQKEGLSR